MAGNPIPTFPIPNRDRNMVQNPQGQTSKQHQEQIRQVREAEQQRLSQLVGRPPADQYDYRKGSPK
jgi:hypothetical protein